MIIGIYAKDLNGGIGIGDNLPWPRLKEDMDLFKKATTNNIVVMGRNTWESLKNKKLPNRINVVISSKEIKGCDYWFSSVEEAVREMCWKHPTKDIFIIGGAKLLYYCMENKILEQISVSTIHAKYECDVFMDETHLINYIKEKDFNIRKQFPTIVVELFKRR